MTLGQLAQAVGARVAADQAGNRVSRVSTLDSAGPEALTFLADERYLERLRASHAGAVLLCEQHVAESPVPCLVCDNPHAAFARAAALLHPAKRPPPGIHPSAVVDAGAHVDPAAHIGALAVVGQGCRIGAGAIVGPGCVLLDDVELGEGVWLVARVTVGPDCRIGARTQIHPGVVIGADGFGLASDDGRWLKVPQLGRVILGEDVEIGANTTIDRGAIEDTILGDGVKIDNLVQVAHNVKIGDHTAIAACAGIAGSAQIGAYCTIGGGVGIAGHLRLVDHVHVTGMSLVARSLDEAGAYSSSMPAQPMRSWQRNAARFRHLDEMAKELKRLEEQSRNDHGDNS
ncbi:UDP-3-O-(3-hydroxymyristoyl)glucosamine N-acyltransferase [Acidihalobacter yilgarnensis]|uniref:UDP-3-O-acylglucosamine N-acyltransferase n=1 Tax=Acidihalobacter yilgarnensis TaxID=2819280 RepID=A0A1D8IPI4_9GAMM|nr:UDP-3-O-(3-hydroxymyristoyl)glucosamine N-acyltransferase [Acidihalobacter yilgarnensis]AOU98363.1 UDP-3-O-(3-hydroxymyristoyl)glucosamine N-acyltransferase [Acidihalobacter yilgarnensis]